jgi:hypothetical protein
LVPFSCGTKSQLVSFSLDLKNCIPFLSAIYLDLVPYLMEPVQSVQHNLSKEIYSQMLYMIEEIGSTSKASKGGKTVMVDNIWQ